MMVLVPSVIQSALFTYDNVQNVLLNLTLKQRTSLYNLLDNKDSETVSRARKLLTSDRRKWLGHIRRFMCYSYPKSQM